MSPREFRAPVTVGATSTSLAVIDVRDTRTVSVAVKNLDGVQTINVSLRTRAHLDDDFAERALMGDLQDIPPGATRAADLDCGVNMELEVLGIASGGGCDANLTVKPDWGRRP